MLKGEPFWHVALFYGGIAAGAAFLLYALWFISRLYIEAVNKLSGGE